MDIVTHVDTAERKLMRVKVNLMRDDRFAFWRGIMMVGKTEVVDNCPTAYTDGYNEGYGRAFIESQNDKQVAFGVLHENLHKIGRDLSLWVKMFKEDAQLANMACDYRHNQLLVDMDPVGLTIEMPTNPDGTRMGLLDERFRSMNPPTIFRILKQEKKDGTGAFGPNGDGTKAQGNFDEHDWEASDQRSDEEKETQAKEVDQALRQGEMEHRKVKGGNNGDMERFLSDMLKPKVNWKDVLADFWRSNCTGRDDNTWRTPNRRYIGMDILLPSTFSQRVGRGVIGADMSGSVGQRETTLMVGEIAYLASQVQPEQIDLLYWDSVVARHETYDETNMDTLATSTKPMGGGGTNPDCVKRYMAQHGMEPEFVIMLTDGYVNNWPDFDCPVLWVITTKNITAPTGITIHLEDNGND